MWWSADLSTTDFPKHCWQDNTPEENSDGVHCNWGSTVLWQPTGSSCAVQHTQWHCGKGWFVTVCVSDQNLPTPSCNEAGLLVIVFQIKTYQHHHAMRLVCWLLCFRSKLTHTIMQWGWFVGYCVSDQNLPTPSCNEADLLVIVFQIKTYQHHHAMRLVCWLLCFRSKLTHTIIAMRLVCWLLCFRSKLTNTIMQWGWFVGICIQIKTYTHHHAVRTGLLVIKGWFVGICVSDQNLHTPSCSKDWFAGVCVSDQTYIHHHAARAGLLVFVFQIKTRIHHHAIRNGLLVICVSDQNLHTPSCSWDWFVDINCISNQNLHTPSGG